MSIATIARHIACSFLLSGALLYSQQQPAASPKKAESKTAAKKITAAAKKGAPTAPADWLTWGGPKRDFITTSRGLADKWTGGVPKKLWTRPLGDGYSPIAVEAGRLYTGYRRGSQDVITALDAATGKTIWEHVYENRFENQWNEVAPGPYAMPQVIGDRILSVSGTGKVFSLDKQTGKPVWSADIYRDFGGTRLGFGYSCHALPYKDYLIFLAGGRGSAVVALRQRDGTPVWKSLSFDNAHSSPLLIDVDGQPQVVALLSNQVMGFNPDNGQFLWRENHVTQYGLAVSTPVWMPGNLLFVASAYGTGGRMLQLKQSGGKTTVTQLWHDPKMQLHFGTAIHHDGYLYFSAGYNGPALLTALEPKSGKAKWQVRGFAKAQLLYAEGKLILLDQEGTLGLVRANPEKFEELGRMPLLTQFAWTPPTLVGTRLYVRDRKTITALDLAK
jgi:outer membrane protein assembly factor BamB